MADVDEVARLLRHAARAHHQAFADSDGVDPEWPAWYAGHLQAPLHDLVGRWVSRSHLTYLLIHAEHQHAASGREEPWPDSYARVIVSDVLGEGGVA